METVSYSAPVDASVTDVRRALLAWLQADRTWRERRSARALGDRRMRTAVRRHAPADVAAGDQLGAWTLTAVGVESWTLCILAVPTPVAQHDTATSTTLTAVAAVRGPARCELTLCATATPAVARPVLAAVHAAVARRARTAARAGLRPGASTVPQRPAARPGASPQR